MNEELKNALGELIKTFLNMKDFVVAELPDIVQQLLLYNFWISMFWVVFSISLGIFSILTFRKGMRIGKECEWRDRDSLEWGTRVIIGPSCMAVSFIVLLENGANLLKIILAPKLYLLEYATDLFSTTP